MTRRDWVLTLGVWLCSSLLSACTHTVGDGAPLATRVPAVQGRDDRQRVAAAESGSPTLATPAALGEKKAEAELPVERANYPSPTADREELSPPRPPAIALGPPADLENEMSQAGGSTPSTLAKPPAEEPALVTALRCFLDKRPSDALTSLKSYDRANQEILLCLLPLAALLTEESLQQANAQKVGAVVEQLDNMGTQLRSWAALTIDQMCFCRRIETFGIFEPYPEDHQFRPGDYVQVYAELRNLASEKRERASGEGTFVIRLASSGEIRDYAGNKVFPRDSSRMIFRRKRPVEESQTLRHDYFDNYNFCVPDLPPGAYTLCIQVEDQGTNPPRTAQRSVDFRVTNLRAQGS
jgi:hypothetical protein